MKTKKLEKRTISPTLAHLNEAKKLQLLCFILLLTTIQSVFSHGTVTSPASRVWNCYQENPENPNSAPCIAAVASHGKQPLYDWNAINQGSVNGQHMLYVQNGNLASGGKPNIYGGMDQVRSDWVATAVTPGAFTVTWTNSAPHATAYYDVYITKADWTPDQPLTWDSLVLLVRTDPSAAASTVNIPVTLPQRTGKHVIYSVWQRSDSPEAFYSASDVDFGGTLSGSDINKSQSYLNQNYPNPFTTSTEIGYQLKKHSHVSFKVYDILGKEISTLINKQQPPGEYRITFKGEHLKNGMYIYVFRAGNSVESRRMILHR